MLATDSQPRLTPLGAALLGLVVASAAACSDDDDDLGDAGASVDAGQTADAGDAPRECQLVEFGDIRLDDAQDVQTIYSAPLTTPLGGAPNDYLVFNFVNYNERFGPGAIGTFSLSNPPNDNRGTCPECLSVFVDQVTPNSAPVKVFFQRAGEIQLDADPRTQLFRGRVRGLELVEVTIDPATLGSTPVPGGDCLRVADFEVDYKFVPETWTCDDALYRAGDYMCNCDCGAPDPDCACDVFMDPNCPDTIESDCPMGSQCTFTEGCRPSCDPFANPPVGCEVGELCIFGDEGPFCSASTDRANPAILGAPCQDLGILIEYCAITDTVPAGVCDDIDELCRPICQGENSCPMGESCYTFSVGPPELGGYGWCRPSGPIPPEEWFCDPSEYGNGQACNCSCGAIDPDCDEGELPTLGCDEGQSCVQGSCR